MIRAGKTRDVAGFVLLGGRLATNECRVNRQKGLCEVRRRVRCVMTSSGEATKVEHAVGGHTPVLVKEVLEHFQDNNLRTFVDCTIGAGGHARAILGAHQEIERYIGIDKDCVALDLARELGPPVEVVRGDFKNVKRLVGGIEGFDGADGVLMDVGVSSMQVDDGSRGFSFMRCGPLDMRMSSRGLSAADLVNGAEEVELAKIIYEYGEERQSRRIARAIVEARRERRIQTTDELVEVILRVKKWRKKGFHPATLVFQALRIAVNGELEALEQGLEQGVQMLKSGGRLGVICFHSLEDRIAKRSLREMASREEVRIVTKRPIMASEEESGSNARSRSAKLRVVEKL